MTKGTKVCDPHLHPISTLSISEEREMFALNYHQPDNTSGNGKAFTWIDGFVSKLILKTWQSVQSSGPGHTTAHSPDFTYLSTRSESLWKSFHQQNKILWPFTYSTLTSPHLIPDSRCWETCRKCFFFFFFLRQEMNKERYSIYWGFTFQHCADRYGERHGCVQQRSAEVYPGKGEVKRWAVYF